MVAAVEVEELELEMVVPAVVVVAVVGGVATSPSVKSS